MSQMQFHATQLRSRERATEKLQRCQGAWRLGRLCPFSAFPQDTDEEAEIGLGPIHGREGRQLLEEDLVEMGFFPLPCCGGSEETEQGRGGELTQERETYGWIRVRQRMLEGRACCLLPHETRGILGGRTGGRGRKEPQGQDLCTGQVTQTTRKKNKKK